MRWCSLLLVSILPSLLAPSDSGAQLASPHDDPARVCGLCHLQTPPTPTAIGAWLPGLESRVCLACHGGNPAFPGPPEQGANLGPDLSNDHPVGIRYGVVGSGPVEHRPALRDTVGGLPLYAGRVECPTCHNPHAPRAGLRQRPHQGSGFCGTCHIK